MAAVEPHEIRARHMCCSEHGVFVEMSDGSMWWRRHEWPAASWQPVIAPPVSVSSQPPPKPARRARRR